MPSWVAPSDGWRSSSTVEGSPSRTENGLTSLCAPLLVDSAQPRMTTALHSDLIKRFTAVADPDRAEGQQRYMKSEMPFHGIRVPEVRRLVRAAVREHPFPDARAWEETVLDMWRSATHREQRYAAVEVAYAAPYRQWLHPERLGLVEEMIVTGAWWDYVDQLASKHMGHLLSCYPKRMRPILLSWAEDSDMWKRRSAILAQLRFKGDTDVRLLRMVIEPSIDEKEFFLRKAIGWALREYSKIDPEAVFRFVSANEQRLSPLSKREALKVIARRRS